MSTPNKCELCKCWNRPGWIINAWQIIPCFKCNPDNSRNLDKPRQIEETEESQATGEGYKRQYGK